MMRIRDLAFGLFLVVVAVSAGVLIGLFSLPRPVPAVLEAAPKLKSVEALPGRFDDAREVRLELVFEPGSPLTVHTSGVVTGSACQPGQPIRSGTIALTIDELPTIALTSDVPIYRDLAIGATGADVRALNAELARLGHSVGDRERFGRESMKALRALFKEGGHEMHDTVLPRSQVLWIPRDEIVPAKCLAQKGATIEPDLPVAETMGRLARASVDLHDTRVVGQRVIEVDGVASPIDSAGVVDEAALGQLGALPSVQGAFQEKGEPPTALTRLAAPVDAYRVPPAALVLESEDKGCVVAEDGELIPVSVVGSTLGFGYFVTEAPLTRKVLLAPETGGSCD